MTSICYPFDAVRALTSRLAMAGTTLTLLMLVGCASGPTANPRDPLEPMNRSITRFNETVDSLLLKPTAIAYREAVPPLARTGVSNFFGNLGDAWSFVNSVLQFKLQNAAENFMRVNVNTIFGLGGILDVASDLQIERHREDFGQTLGRWGVPAGPYIVLPLLGSSTLRDTVALTIDRRGDPVSHIKSTGDATAVTVLRLVDFRSNLLRVSAVLDEAALDKYSFTRDAFLQKRRSEINDGAEEDLGDDADALPSAAPPAATGAPAEATSPVRP